MSFALLTLILPFFGGCTTMMGHTQRIKVATQPEGANIIYKGKILSVTPAFVDIPRNHKNEIRLERQGYPPVQKELTATYRWGDSFFSNFVWLFYGMPVASLVDLETDTCWEYEKLGVIPLGSSLTPEKPTFPNSLVIAPPQTNYELFSDELGSHLQDSARKHFPHTEVVPFEKTHHIFENYSYNYSQKTDDDNIDNLYDQLKVTHVLESTTTNTEDGVLLKTTLKDIYTDQEVSSFEEHLLDSHLRNSKSSFKNFMASFLNVLPNLITFDLDTPSSSLDIKSGASSDNYKGVSNRSNTLLAYISSLGIRSARPPKEVRGIHGVFRFVPALSFAYDRFHFETSSPVNTLSAYTFDWYTLFGGFGPELGLDTRIGYFYADLIPAYSLNWIEGSGNGQDASSRTSTLTVMAETGYEIFASSRINIRFFVRVLGIPPNAFSNLIPSLSGQSVEVDTVSRDVAGLAVGYYFPENRTFVKSLLF